MLYKFFFLILIIPLIQSCVTLESSNNCLKCHKVILDKNHNFSCTFCHNGNDKTLQKKIAHKNLIKNPANYLNAKNSCYPCHKKQVDSSVYSIHYTLHDKIQSIYTHFFDNATQIKTIHDIPFITKPTNQIEVLSDALRRRCLVCHVYYEGEPYRSTKRGLGCASCHLSMKLINASDHSFTKKVPDAVCLTCHYGNFVGYDFYGRFEKDYEEDFREVTDKGQIHRPYGVEYHQLEPDVHMKKGMKCIDCHVGGFCSEKGIVTKSCASCHDPSNGKVIKPFKKSRFGHRDVDIKKIDCAVCHAIWGYIEKGRELTLVMHEDLHNWKYISVQGSKEIEDFFKSYDAGRFVEPVMKDKLNGKFMPGIWMMGFRERRWWPLEIKLIDGMYKVTRPILDIRITYKDEERKIELYKEKDTSLPYMPHTINRGSYQNMMLNEIKP